MNKKYEEYILLDSLLDIDPKKQLDILGILFDGAIDRNSLEGIDKGLLLSEAIEYDLLEPHQKILFHYFISNAWATKRREKSTVFESAWEFNMQENAKELYHLRKAILIKDFDNLPLIRKAQIYTNLGNLLNVIGRFVEAHEFWNKALNIDPFHSMALSNKGKGFFYYGKYLFDEIHAKIFMLHSVLEIKKSLKNPKDFYPTVLEDAIKFTEYLDSFISQEIQDNPPDLNDYSLGDNLQLKLYREWSLANQLYINPINDLGSYNIACHDCLNMPTLYFAFDQPPIYLTLYNQMKQEFGSARFLFYESLIDAQPHISDEDIVITETYQGALNSFSIEKAKMAFRMCYSILDKIAFFLDDYYALGNEKNKINFRTIWVNKKKELRPIFKTSTNWALRGLFWLSKDLHHAYEMGEVVIEPEAREIAAIRNHIEHKAFKVIPAESISTIHYDSKKDLAYTINRKDFENKVMKLLKLVRAAMIYLSLSVNDEEKKKGKPDGTSIPIMPGIVPYFKKV